MGIADRDYMRERHRARIRASVNHRSRKSWKDIAPSLILCICLITYGLHFYAFIKLRNWIPDFVTVQAFPATGTVSVRGDIQLDGSRRPFTIVAADNDAVVQLLDHQSKPVFSVFVRRGETSATLVPAGVWKIRILEGRKWLGREKLFGVNSTYRRSLANFDFRKDGILVDLRGRIDGNLSTRLEFHEPEL